MRRGSGNKAAQPPAERSAAEPTAAEPVERREGTKGNADQQSTHRTQSRASASQALERIRKVFAVTHPKVGAVCVKTARTDLRGGRAMKRVSQVRDLDVPPQLRSRPAKFISFNSSAVD